MYLISQHHPFLSGQFQELQINKVFSCNHVDGEALSGMVCKESNRCTCLPEALGPVLKGQVELLQLPKALLSLGHNPPPLLLWPSLMGALHEHTSSALIATVEDLAC